MATVTVPRQPRPWHRALLVVGTLLLGLAIAALATTWGDGNDDDSGAAAGVPRSEVVFPVDGRAFASSDAVAAAFAEEVLGVAVPAVDLDVRRIGGAWYVVGATGAAVSVTSPAAGAILPSVVAVEGTAPMAASEVRVALLADGTDEPIASTSVPGSTATFGVTLRFDTPSTYWGVLVVQALDAEGVVVDAAAVRVGF